MFEYHSDQVHTVHRNGKGNTTINSVNISGTTGTKEVIVRSAKGKILNKSRKALRKKEIECIRNRKFVPGLFNSCIMTMRKRRISKRLSKVKCQE